MSNSGPINTSKPVEEYEQLRLESMRKIQSRIIKLDEIVPARYDSLAPPPAPLDDKEDDREDFYPSQSQQCDNLDVAALAQTAINNIDSNARLDKDDHLSFETLCKLIRRLKYSIQLANSRLAGDDRVSREMYVDWLKQHIHAEDDYSKTLPKRLLEAEYTYVTKPLLRLVIQLESLTTKVEVCFAGDDPISHSIEVTGKHIAERLRTAMELLKEYVTFGGTDHEDALLESALIGRVTLGQFQELLMVNIACGIVYAEKLEPSIQSFIGVRDADVEAWLEYWGLSLFTEKRLSVLCGESDV